MGVINRRALKQYLRVVRRVDPVVRQRVVHVQWTYLRELLIPDRVFFGEEKTEELQRKIKRGGRTEGKRKS